MGKHVTNLMVNEFKLEELGMDFMGYSLQKDDYYSFHHLIIPRRNCKKEHIPLDGYVKWNGAILSGKVSHPYLHVIEAYDYDRFLAITSEMIDENLKGRIDMKNLLAIDDILSGFEREHSGIYTKRGKPVVKEEYTRRLILKK